MTFYNIIFGILFLASLREVVVAVVLGTGVFWEAAVLTLLVFSDAIYTSHVVEEHKYPYTVQMKLVDLANFLVLACALLVLHPHSDNLLQVSLTPALERLFGGPTPRWPFWTLLTAYWLGLTRWVAIAAVHPDGAYVRDALGVRWPRVPGAFRATAAWIVRLGRVFGLCVSVATTAVAAFVPSALYVVGACVFGLAVFNLLFTAVVFDAYDVAAARASHAPSVAPE